MSVEKKEKILIVHDTFLYKGGGERLMLMMAKALNADLASGFFSEGSFDLRKEGFEGKIIPLSSEIFTKGFRHLKLKYAFFAKTKFLKEYDKIIFSGDCITAARNARKDALKIQYCHTPPRYLYDLYDLYVSKCSWYFKPFFKLGVKVFRWVYERDLKKIDKIITNSKNTQKRIKDYLGLESEVLYPPVDTEKFKFIGQKDYYLSFARLADAKRVDKIVEAFKKMPDKKIIIIYGKNDPQKDKIMDLAKGFSNIEFVTLENNDLLFDYIGNCIATIYVPINEDFGMTPVESMSAGKPCLGVNDGGLKESIIHEKTGLLINPDANPEDIIAGVEYLSKEKCLEMRNDCEARAKDFSLEDFEKKLKELI